MTEHPAHRRYSEYARAGHLGYANRLHQRLRYQGVLTHAPTRGRRVLDFGCGHADLYGALVEAGQRPSLYHAVDLLPENLERARANVRDVLGVEPRESSVRFGGALESTYDVVCCLAVLSVDLGVDTQAQWRRTIAELWARTEETLVFDVQRVEPGFGDANHVRVAPGALAEWARELSVCNLIDNRIADHFSLVVLERRPTVSRDYWRQRG